MIHHSEQKITALVADDDPSGVLLLESMLELMSITTRSAGTVADAKRLVREFQPTIAILDVQLPDGDGVDILLAIREANLETAIAFVTASLEEFPFYKCASTQPDMMFSKPVDQSVICGWVERMLVARGLSKASLSRAG
jgi:DNA-binding response OmpR family regulator